MQKRVVDKWMLKTETYKYPYVCVKDLGPVHKENRTFLVVFICSCLWRNVTILDSDKANYFKNVKKK